MGSVTSDQHHAQSHGAADHSGDVIPAANQDFGAYYSDLAQIVTPANPGAGVRRLFVDSGDGKLKVRTSGGSSVSLEEQGGGVSYAAPTAAIDIGDAAVGGVATTVLRSDAQMAFPAPAAGYPLDVGDTEADGVATTPARSDHVHAHGSRTNATAHQHSNLGGVTSDQHHAQLHEAAHEVGGGDALVDGATVPGDIAATGATGTGTKPPRIGHIHAHPSGLGTDLHHAQSHTHASHTGIGADDHYVHDKGAKVYNSLDISIPNNTETTITFDSETYDTDNIHSIVTNTDRLTCQTAGKYLIMALITWATSNGTGRRQAFIYLNAAAIAIGRNDGLAQASPSAQLVATIHNLAVNDYVNFRCFQDSGGALNALAVSQYSVYFMMARIGA